MSIRYALTVLLSFVGPAFASDLVFGPAVNLSQSDDYPSQVPAIAMGGGGIYVAWLEQIGGTDYVYFTRSLDLGITFSTPINLSNFPGGVASIAADEFGEVFVVWPGAPGIRFAYSTDHGETFSPKTTLPETRGCSDPSIAVDHQGVIYVAWNDPWYQPDHRGKGAVRCSRWDRRTFTITGEAAFSRPAFIGAPYMEAPNITGRAGGGVALVLAAPGINDRQDIFFTQSSDGIRFDPLTNISRNRMLSYGATVAADRFGRVFTFWHDFDAGNSWDSEVVLCTYAGGGSLPFVENLSQDPDGKDTAGHDHNVVVDASGVVTVMWGKSPSTSPPKLVLRRSFDGGRTFGPLQVIPTDPNGSSPAWPTMAVDSEGRIGFAYQQAVYSSIDILFMIASTPPWHR